MHAHVVVSHRDRMEWGVRGARVLWVLVCACVGERVAYEPPGRRTGLEWPKHTLPPRRYRARSAWSGALFCRTPQAHRLGARTQGFLDVGGGMRENRRVLWARQSVWGVGVGAYVRAGARWSMCAWLCVCVCVCPLLCPRLYLWGGVSLLPWMRASACPSPYFLITGNTP